MDLGFSKLKFLDVLEEGRHHAIQTPNGGEQKLNSTEQKIFP